MSSEIQELLALARQKCDAGHLVSPPGDNALELYKKVLDRDPDNAEALEALVDVKSRLAALIESCEPVTDTSTDQEQQEEVKPLAVPASPSVFDLKRTRSPVVTWVGSAAAVLSVAAVIGAFYFRSSDTPKQDTVILNGESSQNTVSSTNVESPPKNMESGEITRRESTTLGFQSSVVPESEPEQTESDIELTTEAEPESAISTITNSAEATNTHLDSPDEELVAVVERPKDVHPSLPEGSVPPDKQRTEVDDETLETSQSSETLLVDKTSPLVAAEQTNPKLGTSSYDDINTDSHDTLEEIIGTKTDETVVAGETAKIGDSGTLESSLTAEQPVESLQTSNENDVNEPDNALEDAIETETEEIVEVEGVAEIDADMVLESPLTTEQAVPILEASDIVRDDASDTAPKEMAETQVDDVVKVEEIAPFEGDETIQSSLVTGQATHASGSGDEEQRATVFDDAQVKITETDIVEVETTQLENKEADQAYETSPTVTDSENSDEMEEQSISLDMVTIDEHDESKFEPLSALLEAQEKTTLGRDGEGQQNSEPQVGQAVDVVAEQNNIELTEEETMVAAILGSEEPEETHLEEITDTQEIDQSTIVEDDAAAQESILEDDNEAGELVGDIKRSLGEEKKGVEIDMLEDMRGAQLIAAVKTDRLEDLSELLARGINVDAINAEGDNALIYAAWEGKNDIVQYLLAQGANVNHKNRIGWTALLSAVTAGHLDTVRLLISSDANIHITSLGGKTALMAAARNGRLEIAHRLLNSGVDVNQTNDEGWTALFYAVWYGHGDIVAKLLEYGADVSIRDNTGISVETVAKNRGHSELIKMLVESA